MISFFFPVKYLSFGGHLSRDFCQEDRIAEENTLKSAETQRGKAGGYPALVFDVEIDEPPIHVSWQSNNSINHK